MFSYLDLELYISFHLEHILIFASVIKNFSHKICITAGPSENRWRHTASGSHRHSDSSGFEKGALYIHKVDEMN